MNKLTSLEIVGNYAGGGHKIKVYSSSGECFLLPPQEAVAILLEQLNAGNETTLEPRQQYKRIHVCQNS